MIQFACSQCAEIITVPDQFAGQPGRCKHCQAAVSVPGDPPTPPAETMDFWTKVHEGPSALRFGALALAWVVVLVVIKFVNPGSPIPAAESGLRKQWKGWQALGDTQGSHISTADITELEVLDEYFGGSNAKVWIRTQHSDGAIRNHLVRVHKTGGNWVYNGSSWFDKVQREKGDPGYFPDEGSDEFEVIQSRQRYAWKALLTDPRNHCRELALRDLVDKPELFAELSVHIAPLIRDPDNFTRRDANRLIMRAKKLPDSCVKILIDGLNETRSPYLKAGLIKKLTSSAVSDESRKAVVVQALRDKALQKALISNLGNVASLSEADYMTLLETSLTLNDRSMALVLQVMSRERISKRKTKSFLVKKFAGMNHNSKFQALRHFSNVGPLESDDLKMLFQFVIDSKNSSLASSATDLLTKTNAKHSRLLFQLCCDFLSKSSRSESGNRLVAKLLRNRESKLPGFNPQQFTATIKHFKIRTRDLKAAILWHCRRGKKTTEQLLKIVELATSRDHIVWNSVINVLQSQLPLDDQVLGAIFKQAFNNENFASSVQFDLPKLGNIEQAKPFLENGLRQTKTLPLTVRLIERYGKSARILVPALREALKNCKDPRLKTTIKHNIKYLTS